MFKYLGWRKAVYKNLQAEIQQYFRPESDYLLGFTFLWYYTYSSRLTLKILNSY